MMHVGNKVLNSALGNVLHSFCKAKNSSCLWRRVPLMNSATRMSQRCALVDKSADLAGHGKTWNIVLL